MTTLNDLDLDQCKTRAKELLKEARAAAPEALDRIRRHHPESDVLLASDRVRLADTQLVIAREQGYASWRRLKDDLLLRNAFRAIDQADLPDPKWPLDSN